MKTRKKPLEQYLHHEINDEEHIQGYLDEALPLVGEVVMTFNGLESDLNSLLCEHINDRTDTAGLLILHKLSYATKVDLLKRFCDDFHLTLKSTPESYSNLIEELKVVGKLRNIIVHADWENTEEDGYTYVSLKISNKGLEQEYKQLTQDSLENVVERIEAARQQLGVYWEKKSQLIYK